MAIHRSMHELGVVSGDSELDDSCTYNHSGGTPRAGAHETHGINERF